MLRKPPPSLFFLCLKLMKRAGTMSDSTPSVVTSALRASGAKLAFLLSGGGRTLKNMLQYLSDKNLANIVVVISDRECHGLTIAGEYDLPFHVLDPNETLVRVEQYECDLVLMGGFLSKLHIPAEWEGRVLNIHPSLLPLHGGEGFYGNAVHQAVLDSGATQTGCTVHFANNEFDKGPIIEQRRVPVIPSDTVEDLAERVFRSECLLYPAALETVLNERR